MREIKFRGYSKKYESWFYGYLVPNAKGNMQIKHVLDNGNTALTTVEEKSIGQYTGIRNKAGQEIYEGDILAEYSNEIEYWTVSYEYGKFEVTSDDCTEDLYELSDLEVIGNIYDNPDLIKE